MTVATFNVNSIRARMPVLVQWLTEAAPDVVVLQETKVEDAKFPLADLEPTGYHVAFHGQPRYNGVAVLSRTPIEAVAMGFGDPEWPDDCRIMTCTVGGLAVVDTYVPNGTAVGGDKWEYKLAWLGRFREFIAARYRPEDPVVWLGDINIAPTGDDVFEPERHVGSVGFHPDEKEALTRILEWGWADCFRRFTEGSGHYTFWEYMIPNGFKRNLGWRIDHVYASPGLVGRCTDCTIDRTPREWERPSDHTPVIATFEL